MSPLTIALIVFVLVLVSGLLGLLLRGLLPDHHLRDESMGMVKLGSSLIATLAALVLGLLIASAKANYDRVSDQITQTAAKIALLDRTLARYGPQTTQTRSLLRTAIASMVETLFSGQTRGVAELDTSQRLARVEQIQGELQQLVPQNDSQRALQARALDIANDIVQTRFLVIAQGEGSLPRAFLVVLVLWLAILFAGFGLVTTRNSTVMVTLVLCALSVAGSIFLIEEMNRPFEGLMKVSSAPIRNALAHLGE